MDRWPEAYLNPAVKPARMEIDQELQGRGLGQELVSWIIALVQDHVATHIGRRLLDFRWRSDIGLIAPSYRAPTLLLAGYAYPDSVCINQARSCFPPARGPQSKVHRC